MQQSGPIINLIRLNMYLESKVLIYALTSHSIYIFVVSGPRGYKS